MPITKMKEAMTALKYIENPKYFQIKKIAKDLDITIRYVYKALANIRYKRNLTETKYLHMLKYLIDFQNNHCGVYQELTEEQVKTLDDIDSLVRKKLKNL